MINIRQANYSDILDIRNCNQELLPENYHFDTYRHCLYFFPELQYVAEDNDKIIGYVLARREKSNCHIMSLAVARAYRKSGIAKNLLESVHRMCDMYKINEVSLEVRRSNVVANKLYSSLHYEKVKVNEEYYADGEDSFSMVRTQEKKYKG